LYEVTLTLTERGKGTVRMTKNAGQKKKEEGNGVEQKQKKTHATFAKAYSAGAALSRTKSKIVKRKKRIVSAYKRRRWASGALLVEGKTRPKNTQKQVMQAGGGGLTSEETMVPKGKKVRGGPR